VDDGERPGRLGEEEEHVVLIDANADGDGSRIVKWVAGACFLGKLSFVAGALADADVAPGRLPGYFLERFGGEVGYKSAPGSSD
jgi:hypothetical protein